MPDETPTGPPTAPRAPRSGRTRPARQPRSAGRAESEHAASELAASDAAASEVAASDPAASTFAASELHASDDVPARAPEFHHRDTMPTRHRMPGTAPVPQGSPGSPDQDDGQKWEDHDWLDEEAGPVVRPYTMTGGRSRPVTSGLSLLTYVEALYAPEADLIHLQPEHRAILRMTRSALSIAEVAGRLDLPVGVVKVLVGDLLQANLVSTFDSDATINPPDESILQAVIDGLRSL